jgi:phosphohistidine phosphatase
VLKRLRRIPERVGSVMVVGHNPAMHVLVLRLAAPDTAEQPDEQLAEVERKLPTGALATLTFGCAWSELGTGCAQLVSYVRPKSLA